MVKLVKQLLELNDEELIKYSTKVYKWWFSYAIFDTEYTKEYILENGWRLFWYYWLTNFRDSEIDSYIEEEFKMKGFSLEEISLILSTKVMKWRFEESDFLLTEEEDREPYIMSIDEKKKVLDDNIDDMISDLDVKITI